MDVKNVMFLCYKPSGRKIRIGDKYDTWGLDILYIDHKKKELPCMCEQMEKFFKECEEDSIRLKTHPDAFCLIMEDDKNIANAFGIKWKYTNDYKFVQFIDTIK